MDDNANMTYLNRAQQRYDHRLRDLVRSSGNIKHATQFGVPRATAHGWLTSDPVAIVSGDVFDMDILQEEVLALRKENELCHSGKPAKSKKSLRRRFFGGGGRSDCSADLRGLTLA